MDLQDALDFVRTHDRTVLSTRRKDGRPQMSLVNSGLVDGAVRISSRSPLAKVRAAIAGGTMLMPGERCSCCRMGSARVARATSVRG